MPVHPHYCPDCDADFDVVTVTVSAPVDPTCPGCRGQAERRFGVPLVKSNTSYFRGAQYGAAQFAGSDPLVRESYLGAARRAGVSTNGKVYMHGLAEYPGDPRAWVDDVGDARRYIESRGWGSPDLGIKARNDVEVPPIPIGEDLVDRALAERVEAGQIDPNEVEEHRNAVRHDITPPYKRHLLKETPVKKGRKPKSFVGPKPPTTKVT